MISPSKIPLDDFVVETRHVGFLLDFHIGYEIPPFDRQSLSQLTHDKRILLVCRNLIDCP